MTVSVQNWKREITYQANSVEVVRSADEIAAIVKDTEGYPSPVRAKGSHHSTTKCIVAEEGTVIDVTRMKRILNIDLDALTITMEAGVLHIDAAKELEKHGLQFYVNVEIGNLTVGSGACGGTKDASYISDGEVEFGQVAAYCTGMKAVQSDGSIIEVTEADGELMEMMRSSYGMLGIIYEVTFRVKKIKPMAVEHVAYHVEDFVDRLDTLIAQNRSMMLYMFPFLDKVVVEYRYDGHGPIKSNSWQWRLRNWVWKTGSPGFARIVSTTVPFKKVRSWIFDRWNEASVWVITTLLKGRNTSPADQIILYPETASFAAYTFSIWGFPRESYGRAILDYFQFCRDYFEKNGYRCDLLNVGYSIAQDRQSLFSYSRHGPVLTLDPVSTGSEGWDGFLTAYNEFCIQHDGTPLFNQTGGITPLQAKAAFSEEIESFLRVRSQHDPAGRFYTPYFKNLFE
jgi:L-gulonolactone oxidase